MTDQGDGKVMGVLKNFLEDVFGEGHSYSIYDGETYGNGNMTLIGALGDVAEFTATLSSDETAILISLLYKLPELDCEADQISSEVYELEDDAFGYSGYSEPQLEVLDEDEFLTCNWIVSVGPLFDGAPKTNEIIEFDKEVKNIIKSHTK